MNEEEFPEELRHELLPTLTHYETKGWSDIEIGWPTASRSATKTVFLHATSPSGRRVHAAFDDESELSGRIGMFLSSSE